MNNVQLLCYVKQHNYRDRTIRQNVVNIYSHCSMQFSENMLMTTTRIYDVSHILSGVWECFKLLKKDVDVELVCFVEQGIHTQQLDQYLNMAIQSGTFKVKSIKALYVMDKDQDTQQLYHAFEDLVYSKPNATVPDQEGNTIELNEDEMLMFMNAMRAFDEMGMSEFRKVTCKISSELSRLSSVYTELLKWHLSNNQEFQSFRYFKNQFQQMA